MNEMTYFLMAPWLIFCFVVIYCEREWLLKRNLATILCFKSKLPEKFKCFIAVDGSMEILKNSWMSKNSIKMKNLKTIYVTKAKNHFKEIIQPPATKLKVPTSLE